MRRNRGAEALVPIVFDEESIPARDGGRRSVLVVVPREGIVLGRERLVALRERPSASTLDEEILRQVRRRSGRVRLLLFRGESDDGKGFWGIDPALGDAEVRELGLLLMRSQLATYRRLIAEGVLVFMHAELGAREVMALRTGSERLAAELAGPREGEDHEMAALRRLDHWATRHLTFFFSLSTAQVLSDILPEKLALIESRAPRLREVLARVPRRALE